MTSGHINLEEGENIKNSAHYMCDGARPNYTQYFVILLSRSNSFCEHCAKANEI